jgi:hypothetical protein
MGLPFRLRPQTGQNFLELIGSKNKSHFKIIEVEVKATDYVDQVEELSESCLAMPKLSKLKVLTAWGLA